MSNPLSPITNSALNVQPSPPIAQKDASIHDFATVTSPLAKPYLQGISDAIDAVDGPPSSPFVSEIDLELSTPQVPHTPSKQRSPQKGQVDNFTNSPNGEPSTAQKNVPKFKIHEDGPASSQGLLENPPNPPKGPSSPSKQIFSELAACRAPTAPQEDEVPQEGIEDTAKNQAFIASRTPTHKDKFSPRKRHERANKQSPIKATPLRYNEGLTAATQSWTQEDISEWSHTVTVGREEQGIDDTCFSAFSEIPAEMTRDLQRSARKAQTDPVSLLCLSSVIK